MPPPSFTPQKKLKVNSKTNHETPKDVISHLKLELELSVARVTLSVPRLCGDGSGFRLARPSKPRGYQGFGKARIALFQWIMNEWMDECLCVSRLRLRHRNREIRFEL